MLAFNENVYESLKYIHVLAAVVWVGGGLYFQFQATRLNRMNDPERMAAFTRDVEFAGQRLLMPASIVVLVVGIILVIYTPSIDFTDTWIAIGLIGAIATAITGAALIGPTVGKLGRLIESEGPASPAVAAGAKKLFAISRIDQIVLLIVIAAMVFKPGA